MKKIFNLAVVAIASMALLSCEQKDGPVAYAAPVMVWEANPDFSTMELSQTMDVNIRVKAEAGIGTFIVKVNSPVLSPVISALTSDNSSDMDLIGDSSLIGALDGLTGGTLPAGEKLAGKTEVNFNLSSLVPMILALSPEKGSDHVFTLEVSDKIGQSFSRKLTFHYGGGNSISVSGADLWNNTASIMVSCAESVKAPAVFFGKKGGTLYELAADEDGKYVAAPSYEISVNAGGFDVLTVKKGTGIYASNVYVAELREGDQVLASCEFSAPEGDAIPNADMNGWSFRVWEDASGKPYNITYPNPEGESFWDSGNNSFLEQYGADGVATVYTPLCMEGAEKGTALLSARMVLGFVFAPGNMYTGDFVYSGFSGTAYFGKQYGWTARPSAFKVRYKANVGVIDQTGSYDPEKDNWKGKQDVMRIYAAVIDWTSQHGVSSGMTEPSGVWDPCLQKSVEEGAIIGYASAEIKESSSDYVMQELDFHWYDTDAKPADGNYSVVISFATSSRGDYLTGCSTNTLLVDSVEWVY